MMFLILVALLLVGVVGVAAWGEGYRQGVEDTEEVYRRIQ